MANSYLNPTGAWNDPSTEAQMQRIADAMEPYLQTNGIAYTRSAPGMPLGKIIAQSNDAHYDLHLALSSQIAPAEMSGQLRGAAVYYYAYSPQGKRAAQIFARQLQRIVPHPEQVQLRPNVSLPELTKTNAPAVLISLGYRDDPEEAAWMRSHVQEIAVNLTESLTLYFGIPFLQPPVRPRQAVVSTQSTALNLRRKPDVHSEIIGKIPKGAEVTVTGSWNGWYVTEYDGKIGYASGAYLSIL